MQEPLLVRSGVAEAPPLPMPWAGRPTARLLHLVARLLAWAPLAAIVGGALFLRLYRLEGFITYYPDTYTQLRSVDNVLSASFPISYLYAPGVALFLAPVFAFLPHTIVSLQATILAAGTALILVAYVAALATTGDRRAALFSAAAVALGATFVFYSRVALFDVINTLLIALSLFLAPLVVRRGALVLLPYALLVFVTITVRYTNPVVLPALFLASLELGSRPLSWRLVADHLRSRAVITVGLVVLALYVAYLGTAFDSLTRFTNAQAGSIIDFGHYLPRLGQYLESMLIGYGQEFHWEDGLTAVTVLAFAAVGARRLWRTNRGLLVPIAYLIIVWSPVHAVYTVFAGRYAMPAFFFLLLLAALGLSVSLGWLGALRRPWQRVGLAGLLALAVALFVGRQLALDAIFIQQWPEEVAYSREKAYDDIRAALRSLDGASPVLLSSQALAVDQANPAVVSYDLIRHSETYGINKDSIDRLVAYVRAQQADGKTVYYHYSEFEDVQSRFRKYELGFDAYFTALQQEFSPRELVRSPIPTRVQRIYVLAPSAATE